MRWILFCLLFVKCSPIMAGNPTYMSARTNPPALWWLIGSNIRGHNATVKENDGGKRRHRCHQCTTAILKGLEGDRYLLARFGHSLIQDLNTFTTWEIIFWKTSQFFVICKKKNANANVISTISVGPKWCLACSPTIHNDLCILIVILLNEHRPNPKLNRVWWHTQLYGIEIMACDC